VGDVSSDNGDGRDARGADETVSSHHDRMVDGSGAPAQRGTQVGRYVLLDPIGSGAMGVVYSAYDPELDRKLALKILHPSRGDAAATHDRLRREAQALARLTHPNVVTVHDVGTHAGRVFVAMEFVAGETLRAWLDRGPMPVAEILRVFEAAGRGLAAAHHAGLVHRDFKPENVLLGRDRSVRVVDFGLARWADEGERVRDDVIESVARDRSSAPLPTIDEPHSHTHESHSLQVSLTRTGGIMGTPAYMAPEQHLGLRATPRSDQFSFCVALWEALWGERPFPGRDLPSLSLSVTEGRLRGLPSEGMHASRPVSSHLHRVLLRGLATKPDDRFEDLDALLAALAHDPVRRRKRVLRIVAINVAAAALVFGAGFWFADRFDRSDAAVSLCEAEHELDGAWDETRRASLRARFAASDMPFAAHASRQLERRLDTYAAQWSEGWRATCETERTVGRSGELELQRECLAERRRELTVFTGALLESGKDAGTRIERSVAAAEALPAISGCLDVTRLRGSANETTEQRERFAELAAGLSEARTLGLLGDPTAGLARARLVEAEARELDHPRMLTRALLQIAQLQRDARELDAAADALVEAYASAERAGEDWLRAEAALELFGLIGFDLNRPVEARVWAKVADALIERIGDPDDLRGRWWMHDGGLLVRESEFATAERSLAQALQVLERAFGPDAPELDGALSRLGTVVREQGDHQRAFEYHQRVLERRRTAYGPDHPDVASAWATLGNDAYFQAHYEDALGYTEEALRILAACFGEDSPAYAMRLNNYAATLQRLGRLDEAETIHRKLLASNTERYGADDVRVSTSLENLGVVLLSLHRFDEAAQMYERSLILRIAAYGLDHTSTATTQSNLGYARFELGDYAGARELYDQAHATWLAKLGPDHQDLALVHGNYGELDLAEGKLASAREQFGKSLALTEAALGRDSAELGSGLTGLARVALEQGEVDEAVEFAQRALDVRNGSGLLPGELAKSQFVLARGLAARDREGDRSRARDLGSLAREEFEKAGAKAEVEAIDAWVKSLR
jgi:serine/threonine protein kinase/tetratricopeptide (TPR) repeat protein